jgi:hypothetical protein
MVDFQLDLITYIREVMIHLIIGESNNGDSQLIKFACAYGVMFFRSDRLMLLSVQFDAQLDF